MAESHPIRRYDLPEEHLGLVRKVIRRFAGRAELEDLFQVGCLGLVKASRRFDPTRGVAFSTYAVPLIIGEIRRYLRDDRMVRVSRSSQALVARARHLRASLLQSEGVEPSLSRIAEIIGVPPADLLFAMEGMTAPSSLDEPVLPGQDLPDVIGDRVAAPGDGVERMLESESLRQACDQLPERERDLVRLRYFSLLTQVETGKRLGMTQVQVSRLEKRALRRLRGYLLET
ncbi:MAG: sigma-70 family RNA polymerase sigma factor [Bacillota bacterium]|nr:sigma-70 family RNA polymerase sigma factor [Bacillota bacterium]